MSEKERMGLKNGVGRVSVVGGGEEKRGGVE